MIRWICAVWAGMMATPLAPLRVWASIGAGIVWAGIVAGFGLVIWKGGWSADRQEQQLTLLGIGMMSALGLVLVVQVSLAGIGLNFSAGKDGVKADLGRDDDGPVSAVTTTTTTEVTPGR